MHDDWYPLGYQTCCPYCMHHSCLCPSPIGSVDQEIQAPQVSLCRIFSGGVTATGWTAVTGAVTGSPRWPCLPAHTRRTTHMVCYHHVVMRARHTTNVCITCARRTIIHVVHTRHVARDRRQARVEARVYAQARGACTTSTRQSASARYSLACGHTRHAHRHAGALRIAKSQTGSMHWLGSTLPVGPGDLTTRFPSDF
jgi:hypothetical protein